MKKEAIISVFWNKNIDGLYEYLKRKPVNVLTFADHYSVELEQVVTSLGAELIVIEQELGEEDLAALYRDASERIIACSEMMNNDEWSQYCHDREINQGVFTGLVETHVRNSILPLMSRIYALEKVCNRYDISLVSVNEEYTGLMKALVLWAKSKNIPVLHLLHGTGLARAYTVHAVANCDVYGAVNERCVELLQDLGVEQNTISITGLPSWDVYEPLRARRAQLREFIWNKYHLQKNTYIIAFFTTWVANLTDHCDPAVYNETLKKVLHAVSAIVHKGYDVCLVIKGRPATNGMNVDDIQRLSSELSISGNVAYTEEDTEILVTGADITISVDSNIAIESAYAKTPAINLVTKSGWLLGPSFAGTDGVIEVEMDDLSDCIINHVRDRHIYNMHTKKLFENKKFISLGDECDAKSRLASLMEDSCMNNDQSNDKPGVDYLWKTLDRDVDVDIDMLYHGTPRSELFPLFKHAPRVVLEVGCAAGATGEAIKKMYPGVTVYGVELNAKAAEIAKTRIDGVINKNIESCDISELGIEFGTVDTFIAADVLEHLYNPWAVLDKIKPLLTKDAQVIVSIPNSQNAWLMTEMASGRWSYESQGLLDITHIRFFTRDEITKMFDDTGYDTVKWSMTLDGRVPEISLQEGEVQSIDLGKIVFKDITKGEWMIYRALQFLVCATLREGQVTYSVNHQKKQKSKAKIVLYTFEQPAWACAELRVNSPLRLLGDEVELVWGVQFNGDQMSFDDSHLSTADAIIFHRFFPCKESWPFIEMVLASGKPVIYEIDDLLCSMPELNPSASESAKIKSYIFDLLGRVDNVVVSTNKLAANYAPYAKNIFVVPNRLDVGSWGESKSLRPAQKRIVIGYLGTPTHLADLAIIEDALFRLAEKYGDQISFRFMGCITENLKSLANMHFTNMMASYAEYINIIKDLDIDIALAPLENNPFNKSKSNIKWMEYSYCGIPGVYTNLEPYVDSVINYETGILATHDSESWFTAIDYLITHPYERTKIGNNARNAVASHYMIEHGQSNIADVYRGLLLDKDIQITVENANVMHAGCQINQVIPQTYSNGDSFVDDDQSSMDISPSIHLLLLAGDGQEALIESSLASLLTQDYKSWGLTVISTAASDSPVYDQMDNLEWVIVEQDWQQTIQRSISETSADWVGFIKPGDQFDIQMLSLAVKCFNQHLDALMIYLGMDYMDNDGQIKYFKNEGNTNSQDTQHADMPELSFIIRGNVIDVLPALDEHTQIDHCQIANELVARGGISSISAVKNKVYHRLDCNPMPRDMKNKAVTKSVSVNTDKQNPQADSIEPSLSNMNTGISANTNDANHLDAAKKYEIWCKQHALSEIDAQILAERMYRGWSYQPIFHLVCLLEDDQFAELADTIDSLATQFYKGWKLSIVAEFACNNDEVNNIDNIAWYQYKSNDTDALNSIITDTKSDWVILLQAGTSLEVNTLMVFADYANEYPEWQCIYSDHDYYENDGCYSNPFFKPDLNFDYLCSMNYIGDAVAFKRKSIIDVGGYSVDDGFKNYDMILRLINKHGESAVGHINDLLFHFVKNNEIYNEDTHKSVLNSYFAHQLVDVSIVQGYLPETLRVIYRHEEKPLVSIIIPTRDMLEFMQPCVESLFDKTSYSNYELIVVDNGSDDPDVHDFYALMSKKYQEKIRIVEYPFEFNFAAMINLGVMHAQGDYVLPLNNDTVMIQSEWLSRMMTHAQRRDVGIVGAKLLFPGSGNIQHAGVVIGMDDIAGHPYINAIDLKDPGYMSRAQVDQEYSAVTGACLLARKDIYNQVGGMDDESLKVSYNDVDFCLKVKQAGYKVLWTPYAVLLHHGSVSQVETQSNAENKYQRIIGFRKEQETMIRRWKDVIANDSCYNKNLSLSVTQPEPEFSCVINWYGASKERPRIFGMPVSGGSGEYRVKAPLRSLARAGIAQVDFTYSPHHQTQRILTLSELIRTEADAILVQNFLGDSSLDALEKYKNMTDVYITYALDDLITNVPEGNEYRKNIPANARTRLRKGLMLCDRLIVSTEPLRDLCGNMIDDIVVIPNYLESNIWSNLHSERHAGPKPRVGWAGAQQHSDDLAFIEEVVKSTADEIDWIFFGMCPDSIRRYVKEVHGFEFDFEKYAEKLASLNLDLAVAPLMQHPFNEAKSNLRLLEYGAMGWPVICTDIFPYQNAPVKRVDNDAASWIAAVRERIHDLDAAYKEGDELKQWVLSNHMLDQHVETWSENLLSSELKRAYQDIWQESRKLISR